MKVKLERIKNGVALRTSEVIGHTGEYPIAGRRFLMTAPPLDPTVGNTRVVCTSVVSQVTFDGATLSEDAKSWTFLTENSTYRLTRLPDEE